MTAIYYTFVIANLSPVIYHSYCILYILCRLTTRRSLTGMLIKNRTMFIPRTLNCGIKTT